jgi:hypothetical protein
MSSCWISYEHLQQKGESTNQNGHDLHLIKKYYLIVRESDGEVGIAVVWYSQGCGFYSLSGQFLMALF